MKSEVEKIQEVCTDAGVQFIESDGQFVFFRDNVTKEQAKVKIEEFTNARVQSKVRVIRKKYSKDVDMLSDFRDAINFLTKKYFLVPSRAIDEAAQAATITIQQYVNEGNNGKKTAHQTTVSN